MSTNDTGETAEQTLEDHELALKRALESLGPLEDRFQELVTDAETDERERLEPLGRALESHVERLETVVRTLDTHKQVANGDFEDVSSGLEAALARSRRRAQQEPTPGGNDPTSDERGL